MGEYLRVSRSGSYGFVMALPLVVGYEIMMLISNSNTRAGAETMLRSLVAHGHFAFMIVLIVLGATIFFVERKKELPFRPRYLWMMLVESICWAPIFAVTVGFLTSRAIPGVILAAGPPQLDLAGKIGISLGAGVYEEFLFRVCIVGGMAAIGTQLYPKDKAAVYITCATIGALIFSAFHYVGEYGYELELGSFIFRTIAGLILNALYLWRGFGIAAWTHAIYDIMVFTAQSMT